MKCDYQPSHLARTFASPYLGCEAKAKVATITFKFFEKRLPSMTYGVEIA
jgi:hypothetical protein